MEELSLRILVRHERGATLAYIYNREALELITTNGTKTTHSQFYEIGNTITYGENEYQIESYSFRMYDEIQEMGNLGGVNLHSPTEQSDFNCELEIVVSSI